MVLLVLWRLLELVVGHREEDGADLWRKRGADVLKMGIYGTLALSCVLRGLRGQGRGVQDRHVLRQADEPAVRGVARRRGGTGHHGIRRRPGPARPSEEHAKHLAAEGKSGDAGSAYLLLGKVGYIAKGVAIGLVGALFGYAAVTHDPKKSGGLDAALQEVLEQPFGPVLLGAIGLGLICYGLFCFARARHLSR